MKRLITICAVVGLMLGLTCVSWATVEPNVNPPPSVPSWWNTECIWYAYGWWEVDITPGSGEASPPFDVTHWASNFLGNTAFDANIGITNQTISLDLDNVYRQDLKKELYIYITGTTISTTGDILNTLDTDGGTFQGSFGGSIENGLWTYFVSGEIIPQPDYVHLMVTVPGMTSVTDIWAGENCIVPEPATITLVGFAGAIMLRKRHRR